MDYLDISADIHIEFHSTISMMNKGIDMFHIHFGCTSRCYGITSVHHIQMWYCTGNNILGNVQQNNTLDASLCARGTNFSRFSSVWNTLLPIARSQPNRCKCIYRTSSVSHIFEVWALSIWVFLPSSSLLFLSGSPRMRDRYWVGVRDWRVISKDEPSSRSSLWWWWWSSSSSLEEADLCKGHRYRDKVELSVRHWQTWIASNSTVQIWDTEYVHRHTQVCDA